MRDMVLPAPVHIHRMDVCCCHMCGSGQRGRAWVRSVKVAVRRIAHTLPSIARACYYAHSERSLSKSSGPILGTDLPTDRLS